MGRGNGATGQDTKSAKASRSAGKKRGGGAAPSARLLHHGGRDAVLQRDGEPGCAVACVAFVRRGTFDAALSLFKNPERAEKRGGAGFKRHEVLAALHTKARGIEDVSYVLTPFTNRDRESRAADVPECAIACVELPDCLHYVVRYKSMWMCPESGFVSELGGIVRSYLGPAADPSR